MDYKNFLTRTFYTQIFLNTKISRIMVFSISMLSIDRLFNLCMPYRVVKKQSLSQSGSVALLVVRNHHSYGKGQFLGMCVFSCAKIPHGEDRKVECLPLFQFTDISSKSFTQLQGRKEDAAIQLYRLMKTLVVSKKYLH